ncbi:LCP family protein [Streptomyces spectabilis]|uniref:Anionic cell wall polymer biosynthesis LytR-Cps2A-Psr (LCP) family protein n=1 Tax=Streptomyces spectabilis TaxID=68270 RepID=A0A5P2XBX5_STRST|nr:LCP family protein [Streptomyces spectabilis]MBB5103478.1 anionic cell wall polymer biosynthesis LytR-Cps2A-Psr (LCP) family protein [Streptomyces spectabilis]MCI3902668.1 LCP family protein [Streptomyces spectabilis]QEV59982.1 LytR family transcriptional regulator [Streptomyces spectabilis]GGV49381.1 membrane protein [Streptomyces spectabilis]
MNDRQYDPYGGEYEGDAAAQYEVVGYDEYGRPVYQLVPRQAAAPAYDTYAAQSSQAEAPSQQTYGYDPYVQGAGQQPAASAYPQAYDAYATGTSYDTGASQGGGASHGGGAGYGTGEQTGWIPQQQQQQQQPPQVPQQAYPAGPEAAPDERAGAEAHDTDEPREYRTEQFSFIEEPDEDSEDVIDWLKFTESRTERREEAKRRGRSRVVALVVVLALALVGGVGYLWTAGKLPGQSDDKSGGAAAAGPQKRDVVVVHLHNTKRGGTSTVLLVNNTTTQRGSAVLLPNSLALTSDDGTTTTLGKSVDDDGSTGTREELDTLLGTKVEGTWRLDTPYLNNLVELVGNIDIDTNVDVPDPKAKRKGEAPLVKKGEQQTLSGPMAVAYATYRAPGEGENAQLTRFGQVMQGVLRKLSSDPQAATVTVQSLAQILDPSLKEKDLGSFLAKLADRAKGGDYATALLPVRQDGTLTEKAGAGVVKDVLGGVVKSPEQGAAVRVGVKNATGTKTATESARIALVNGGYTFVDGGTGSAPATSSQVTYGDAEKKQEAAEVAKTLGLPASAVRKGDSGSNAEVSVVLGQDYKSR